MTVLVTGATGCVGAATVLELLRSTAQDVVCLVRGHDDAEAHARLRRTLAEAARAYGCEELAEPVRARCRGIRGDVTEPLCGVGALDPGITELWHLAGSLYYLDRHRAEIDAVNITGTGNAIALARKSGIGVLNHASTVATAGTRTGLLYEEPVDPDTPMNNAYERSKVAAERLAAHSGIDVVRILRLPAVVGHSETHRLTASTFSGVYTLTNELVRFRDAVEDRLGAYLEHYGVQVIADPEVRNAVLPVDRVARAIVLLSLAGAASGIYTVANLGSANVRALMSGVADAIGIAEPRYVDDPALLTSIDRQFTDELRFHAPYLRQDKLYDCSNLLRHVDRDVVTVAISRADFAAYARSYLAASAPSQLAATE
ncbi:MAG: SDR family oxidoreductase [Mycobacteriales bacterium]